MVLAFADHLVYDLVVQRYGAELHIRLRKPFLHPVEILDVACVIVFVPQVVQVGNDRVPPVCFIRFFK